MIYRNDNIHTGLGKMASKREHKAKVRIPKGGLRPGLLMNDLTQTMTPEDAELVKRNLPFYRRSGPGLLPQAASGAIHGGTLGYVLSQLASPFVKPGRRTAAGALLGALAFPSIGYAGVRSGWYNKQALNASRQIIATAREKEKRRKKLRKKLRKNLMSKQR